MTHQNFKYCRGLPTAMLALLIGSAIPLAANADTDQFNITFKARILATTCKMAIGDGAVGSAATIYIGDADHKVTLGDLMTEKDSTATSGPTITAFNIRASDCPVSLQSIKTTITGTKNGDKVLVPSSTGQGDAKGVGVKIARTSTPDQPFTIFSGTTASTDGSEVIIWNTASEVGAGKQLDLIAHLVPTSTTTSGLTTGTFNAVATFNFDYE
ncbi:TPA: fimbrial protein [Citrobacter freundii]|uniref:fimbrial protein n=1 Tax=Citrobacter freundii TaxID=546 RepID=UPI00383B87D9|nr:fimbrial protein [Citrobacter freundii]